MTHDSEYPRCKRRADGLGDGSPMMADHPDHELEVLEEDETIPPRPEEEIADADRDESLTP
ncbi:MAG: hypothetical protein ACRDSE_01130 [Pseudonocardiaceae bacterium]